MANDQKHEKQSILGELESIKDLLNEQDLDDIPVLNDAITDEFNPIPLLSDILDPAELDQSDDDPVSEPPLTTHFNEPDDSFLPDSDHPEPESLPFNADYLWDEASTDHEADPVSPETDDVDKLTSDTLSTIYQSDEQAFSLDDPSQDTGDTDDTLAGDEDAEDVSEDEGLELAMSAYQHLFAEVGIDLDNHLRPQTDIANPTQAEPPSLADTPDMTLAVQAETAEAIHSDSRQNDNHSDNQNDSHNDKHNDKQSNGLEQPLLEEGEIPSEPESEKVFPAPLLAPGALPGQQSLFSDHSSASDQSSSARPNTNTVSTSTSIDEQLTALQTQPSPSLNTELPPESAEEKTAESAFTSPRTAEINARPTKSATHSHRQAVKPKGENPFLPKHIRDRLHTQKALIDIIHEEQPQRSAKPVAPPAVSPPAPSATPQPLDQLIDELVAEYLPKIEQQLRQRLKEKLQK